MMIGISTRSVAIEASLALSDERSGVPGAYERIGSFTGGGTRRIPLNGTRPGAAAVAVSVGRECDAGRVVGSATGADMGPLEAEDSEEAGGRKQEAGEERNVSIRSLLPLPPASCLLLPQRYRDETPTRTV